MKKIIITGASGQLGKSVAQFLANKTDVSNVAVLARNAESVADLKDLGIEVRIGDYNDYESLKTAFAGIDKVYLVSGNDIENRAQQQLNVVNAAKEAGVDHVVYTSFQRVNETETSPIAFVAQSHLSTENALKASGLNYTILKHNLYMDLLPWFVGEKVAETKTIFLPAGQGKTAFVLRSELAEAGANVLLQDGHENKTYNFDGAEAISYEDVASDLSATLGGKINYVATDAETFGKELSGAGVPAEVIGMLSGFNLAIAAGEFNNTSRDTETLLGRKPTSATDYLKSVYGSN